jgi:hemerythrin-like metal-binding protein
MQNNTATALHTQLPQTGHGSIDGDHDELLNLVIEIPGLSDDELAAAFAQMHARFAEHFSMEDALMEAGDFSSKQCHLDEHVAVLKSFGEVSTLLDGGNFQTARAMATQLIKWLPEHIDALDRHLAKFVFQQRTGGAPILLHRR